MATRYYERGRERYPRTDELWLDPPGNLFRDDRVDERVGPYEHVLSLPQHNGESRPLSTLHDRALTSIHADGFAGDGAFAANASRGYPSPATESSRYSLNSSLIDSVAARSPVSSEPVLVSRESAASGSFASWQDVGTLAIAPGRQSRSQHSLQPADEVWQWSANTSFRVGDESDWVSPSFPSSFTFISGSDSQPSGADSLEMSIDSEQWRRVRARSRNISTSTLSRAEAEAYLARRKQMEGAEPLKETFWEALLRTLLMLDGATLRLLKGEEGGSLFFDGKEAPLLAESVPAAEETSKPPQERALTTFLSHVASSLSPAAALKRGLSILPLRHPPTPVSAAATPPKVHPDDAKHATHWMASTAGAVAWYALSALPLLISLEAGGRVWRVWRVAESRDA
ncbi:hypothetical protein CALCODRAFT_288891 [Calocera cornea HHB12733]|uniref:Uncharacterized protein n=1 Tax=Calocera cornea HHB12733 TaxID=1353952 RepID=A0A165FVN1_9BASI|nr:hypothetical protein CALCODRAFT_288891 [Calocera cornea HHB12733]